MGHPSFSAQDKTRLNSRGITPAQAAEQLARFKKGFPFAELISPCTAGKGILRLGAKEQKKAQQKFVQNAPRKKFLKFIPASGAASRMFHFLEDPKPEQAAAKQKFLNRISDFAFYAQLAQVLKKEGHEIAALKKSKKLAPIIRALLEKEGLGYRQAPKGMILFHRSGKNSRTAFEDQLREAALFESAQKKTHAHFTLPAAARTEVRQHLKKVKAAIPRRQFILSDSIQSPATDCLAVEKNGAPVRDEKKQILLRPAGHGALLANLNQIKADLIYVKNIDNILPPEHRAEADRWKKILCGVF